MACDWSSASLFGMRATAARRNLLQAVLLTMAPGTAARGIAACPAQSLSLRPWFQQDAGSWATLLGRKSHSKAFAAGTVRDSVGIGHFEAAFLQIFAVIEYGAADEKRAFGIDNEMDILRGHENISLLWAID